MTTVKSMTIENEQVTVASCSNQAFNALMAWIGGSAQIVIVNQNNETEDDAPFYAARVKGVDKRGVLVGVDAWYPLWGFDPDNAVPVQYAEV